MTSKELHFMFRESGEVSYLVFLDKYIEFIEEEE